MYKRQEQHLNLSQYRDFAKLYQFANIKQRRFLDLYFMHYEITILKTCLRNAAGHREQRQDLSMFRDFFERHSALDLITLSQSQSMEEFIGNLKGSAYYGPLYQMLQNGRVTLPACETALDMLYFRSMWKTKDKYLSKNEQKIISQCFGTRMDTVSYTHLDVYKRQDFPHAHAVRRKFSQIGYTLCIINEILGTDDVARLQQRIDSAAAAVCQYVFYTGFP